MKTFPLLLAVLLVSLPPFSAKAKETLAPPAFAAEPVKTQTGVASWYGVGFIGGKTANGETYRSQDKTAAHKSLPFGTWVRVIDQRSGRSTIVRINNRGPFVKGRVIDLSRAAASEIGLMSRGLTRVKLEVLRALPAGRKKVADAGIHSNPPVRHAWLQLLVGVNLPLTAPL